MERQDLLEKLYSGELKRRKELAFNVALNDMLLVQGVSSVCMCVCARARAWERERASERKRKSERERADEWFVFPDCWGSVVQNGPERAAQIQIRIIYYHHVMSFFFSKKELWCKTKTV
jgi:hypothetical protein